MSISAAGLWLLLGILLIILEFSQLPGIGFLFLGLGAISTSVILNYWPQEIIIQISCFGIISLLWFLVLWYPLKTFLYKETSKLSREAFNIIGSVVTVINQDIKAGKLGQVEWSGTIMNAKLLDKNQDVAKVGDELIVLRVQGNTLICSKSDS